MVRWRRPARFRTETRRSGPPPRSKIPFQSRSRKSAQGRIRRPRTRAGCTTATGRPPATGGPPKLLEWLREHPDVCDPRATQ